MEEEEEGDTYPLLVELETLLSTNRAAGQQHNARTDERITAVLLSMRKERRYAKGLFLCRFLFVFPSRCLLCTASCWKACTPKLRRQPCSRGALEAVC